LAEQVVAAQDHFALALPQGWAIKPAWQDPAASIFHLQGAAYGVDATLYAIHLDNHPDRTAAQIVEGFQQVEAVSKRAPAQAPQLQGTHPSCALTFARLQDATSQVVFIWCQHPAAPLLYLWRMEVPEALLQRADSLALNLWRFTTANLVLLDPTTQQPIGPTPPDLSLPPKATPTPPAPAPAPAPSPEDAPPSP
jgi:hypothetical protein